MKEFHNCCGMPAPAMENGYNLFKGFADLKLPIEVCLKIVEDTVDIDPKNAQVLMCLSKVGSLILHSTGLVLSSTLAALQLYQDINRLNRISVP